MAQFITGPIGSGAFGVDDVYLAVLAPNAQIGVPGVSFNGASTGPATWGPLNTPLTSGQPQDLFTNWGPPIANGLVQEAGLFLGQFPIGGHIGVRIDDTTGAKATNTITDGAATGFTANGFFTGTFGNQIQVLLTQGTNYTVSAKTYKVIIQAGSNAAEIFDRIPTGGGGVGPWPNIVSAINNGQNALRPASKWITAAIGSSTVEPTFPGSGITLVTLAGGTDGTASLTPSMYIGVDGASGSRTGMYALRGMTWDALWISNLTDSTQWANVLTFAKSNQSTAYLSLPTGGSVASAVTAKFASGIDDPWAVFCKDFVSFSDTVLGSVYSVAPACVIAGMACANDAPFSPSNHAANGIVGTEQTIAAGFQPYSLVDLATLEAAGILVITNPIPSGRKLGLHYGKNSSSNFATSEIPYTRMTNFLMRSLGGPVMGQFVGLLQTTAQNDPLRINVYHAISDFLGTLQSQGGIVAFKVVCDLTNNPPSSIRSGLLRADVTVQYGAVVDKFLINLTAGQTISVASANQLAA